MDDVIVAELLERCRHDHHAWINGDGSPYELPDDGSVMGAVGGVARGGPDTAARQAAVAGQWRRGRGSIEVVNGGVDRDVAWLAFVERAVVEFVSDPPGDERRWDLRVTEVFRRVDGAWQRVHRHADPLVELRPLRQVRRLAE